VRQLATSGLALKIDDRARLRESVEDDGFAIVSPVLSTNEILTLLGDLRDLDHRPGRAGVRHILRHPAVNRIANDSRLLAIAWQILGENASPFRATLFDKSPGANWLIAWHQDTALPLRERRDATGWGPWSVKEGIVYAHAPARALERVLALRLHLDDCTQTNGPLRVLPHTHKLGVLTDAEVEQQVANREAVECVVAAGGVLVMRPLIVHASSKSTSSIARRVLHIEYAADAEIWDGLRLAMT
jgi:ectoine hydroxylase-related dioxygenase (phytanoyl-CoA dioxygenase family)